ncbi:MAG: hypothetical protein JW967_10770 [Dehalococcoidales bacterium]|nr:hypothetical protein [Dehalococcoidales bacterium]
MARPRVEADFATVLRMHDVEGMGWSKMAEAYRKLSSRYISRDTIKRRYLEAKKFQAVLESLPKLLPAPRVIKAIIIAREVKGNHYTILKSTKTVIRRILTPNSKNNPSQ